MNNKKTKVFAMYLPQYHEVEENSLFWGKGFTDWVTVRKAEPLFCGHEQPKTPLNRYYYDLSNVEDIRKQIELANKFGVDGFGIYHYWFNSEKCLLTKPAEIILKNKNLEIPFFFAWDNASWKRTWSKLAGNDWSPIQDARKEQNGPEILIEYKLGNESDWKKHFEFLLPYFKDSRYEKYNNCPIFIIFNYSPQIEEMGKYWNRLAIDNGFNGIELIYSYNPFHGIPKRVKKFTYEPLFSGWGSYIDRAKRLVIKKQQSSVKVFDYDKIWTRILRNASFCIDRNRYYGAFVNYDDTPRRGSRGKVVINGTPGKFAKYLHSLKRISEGQGKEYIFLTAWNEWGEGAYLEPDESNKYDYLKAYKMACSIIEEL